MASLATSWPAIAEGRRAPVDWWLRGVMFLVVGYFVMGRSFAYLGIPPLKLFIGELALIGFLVMNQRASFDRVRSALSRKTILSDFSWALVGLLLYGMCEVFRGAYLGYSALNAVQSFVFNYYPLYLLLGLWIGERDQTFVRRTIIRLSWVNGIYGILYIGFLSRSGIFIPGAQGSQVPLFGQPWGSPIALLGLICLDIDIRKTWLPLLLNSIVLLAIQVRAEWVALVVGLVVYAAISRRFDKVIGIGAVTALLLIIGLVADIRLPGAASRGGAISTRDIVGRAIAPINKDLAAELTPFAKSNAGTFEWRANWWKAIWQDNQKDAETAAFGEGYGYPLVDLVDYLRGQTFLRTPHNMFFFALGYGGWIMVGLFALLQFFVLRLLIGAWRISRNPFGLVFFAAVITWSLFGDSFETPYGAIPYFVIAGASIAPVMQARKFLQSLPQRSLRQVRGKHAYSYGA